MSDRNIYLTTIPPEQAVETTREALDRDSLVGIETLSSRQACGRVLAEPVYARVSSPTFHSAAMDGIAVRAETTFAAREDAPLWLKKGYDYLPVNTGNPLPEGFDAVIMIEHVNTIDEHTVEITAPAFPYAHVRRIGEDIVATELLLPQNRVLSACDVGALLSAGIWEVRVRERVKMVFLPTGDEVLDPDTWPEPEPGQVIESNSSVFAGLAAQWGAEVRVGSIVPDTPQDLLSAIERELDSDAQVIVVGAGSSAGAKDFTRKVFETLGRVLVHGISVMPGKPTVLGEARGKLLVGAPGYPVSMVVCMEDVLAPLACWLGHRPKPEVREIDCALARKVPSRLGMEEVVRLAVGRVDDRFVGVPLARGAGLITSLTRAQATCRVPTDSEGVAQGETVRARLRVGRGELERILVHVGSHDNTLDLLHNELMGLAEPMALASTHAGSMGGLAALRDGMALFAGAHLFDPDTNDFNFPFFERHLPKVDVEVVNLAIRHQGLIIRPGNPRGIQGIKDLARAEVRFVNRQRGAGTRILLDHHLAMAEINPGEVRGYRREEHTHMAVAVNVLSGAADCGLGIMAAAKALGLDFMPLAHERYDLIIPKKHLDDPRIAALLELIRSNSFQKKIKALGGYETTLTGKAMQPGQGLDE